MKKLTPWVGLIAMGMFSVSLLTGCSGDDTPPVNAAAGTTGTAGTGAGVAGAGTAGTAGAGTAGTGSGTAGGTQLNGPAGYTILSGADAAPGTAAPAAYTGTGCNVCHGANGEGFTGLAPEIRHIGTTYGTYIIRNGRTVNGAPTGMTAYNDTLVSATDLPAILTWLQSLPKPTSGPSLYKDFCGNCHGPSTPTGGLAPVNIQGVSMAELQMKVRMGVGTDPSMRNTYMPAFSVTELTDAELGSIAQFIGAK
jgi:mono/diheme cytochrome c family protein